MDSILEDDPDDLDYELDIGNEDEDALLADDGDYDAGEDEYDERHAEDVLVLNAEADLDSELQDTAELQDETAAVERRHLETFDAPRDTNQSAAEDSHYAEESEADTDNHMSQTNESEDEEKHSSERVRFRTERDAEGGNVQPRTTIPDSLDFTPNSSFNRQQQPGRGRGRGARRGWGNQRPQNQMWPNRPFQQRGGNGNRGAGNMPPRFMQRGGGRMMMRPPASPPKKILINPHFTGTVRTQADSARLVWDTQPPSNAVSLMENMRGGPYPQPQQDTGYAGQQAFGQEKYTVSNSNQWSPLQQQQELHFSSQHSMPQGQSTPLLQYPPPQQQQPFPQQPPAPPSTNLPSPWLSGYQPGDAYQPAPPDQQPHTPQLLQQQQQQQQQFNFPQPFLHQLHHEQALNQKITLQQLQQQQQQILQQQQQQHTYLEQHYNQTLPSPGMQQHVPEPYDHAQQHQHQQQQQQEEEFQQHEFQRFQHKRKIQEQIVRPFNSSPRLAFPTPHPQRPSVEPWLQSPANMHLPARPQNQQQPQMRPQNQHPQMRLQNQQPQMRPQPRPQMRPQAGRPQMRPQARPPMRPEIRPLLRPLLRPQMRPQMRAQSQPQYQESSEPQMNIRPAHQVLRGQQQYAPASARAQGPSFPKRPKIEPDSPEWNQSEEHELSTPTSSAPRMGLTIKVEIEEDEDEATREYRLKIEEQKRLREAVIQQKEERRLRRLAEREQAHTESEGQAAGGPSQGSAIATIVNRHAVLPCAAPAAKKQPTYSPIQATTPAIRPRAPASANAPTAPVAPRVVQQTVTMVRGGGIRFPARALGTGARAAAPPRGSSAVGNPILTLHKRRVVNNNGPPQTIQQVAEGLLSGQQRLVSSPAPQQRLVRSPAPQQRLVFTGKTETSGNARTVIDNTRAATSDARTVIDARTAIDNTRTVTVRPKGPASAQRIVRPAANQARVAPLLKNTQELSKLEKTKFVSISNLSANTTEADISSMCRSVGVVEKFEMVKAERKAMIVFASPLSGPLFFTKYNRKMIDLSLVDVCLHL